MYLPEELVDIIIDFTKEIRAKEHMRENVLPELLTVLPSFMKMRCRMCVSEGAMCVYCAHDYGYKSGPGYYCGKRYVDHGTLHEGVGNYLVELDEWQEKSGGEYYMGGDVDDDMYAMTLRYHKNKYTKRTIECLMFEGRLAGLHDVMLSLIDLYCNMCSLGVCHNVDNINNFCVSRNISEYTDDIKRVWSRVML